MQEINLKLDESQFTRHMGLSSLLLSRTPISQIKSRNLIVEFCESPPTHLSQKVLSSLKS